MGLSEYTNIFLLAGTAMFGVGTVLHLVGLRTDYWVITQSKGWMKTDVNSGLFSFCRDYRDNEECYEFKKATSSLKGTQATAVTGAMLGCAAMALIVLHLILGCVYRQHRSLLILASLCSALAAFFVLLAVIIFSADARQDIERKVATPGLERDKKFGYSFALSVVGGVLMSIGTVPFVIATVTAFAR